MDEFDALFSALEDFVNDSQYLHSGVGGGLHPGEPLLAEVICYKPLILCIRTRGFCFTLNFPARSHRERKHVFH